MCLPIALTITPNANTLLSNLQAAGCPNEFGDFRATFGLIIYYAFSQDIYAHKMQ
jgi:hypothetical protein